MGKINPNTSMLLDVQYVRANRKENKPDCIYTIYKDLETGEKHVIPMENPKIPIYFEKQEEVDHRYPVDYMYKNKCTQKVCKYTDIPFEIAKEIGEPGQRFLRNIFETRNYRDLRMLNTYPYVFGHDYDIRTFYRFSWKKGVNANIIPEFRKGYMDIECDSFDVIGFPTPEKNPIDLVTVIDGKDKQTYTFGLVGREYQPMNDGTRYMRDINPRAKEMYEKKEAYRKEMYANRHRMEQEVLDDLDGFKREIHDKFDESYPGFEFNLYFYTDERQMLVHLFDLIHQVSPDFMMVWNISFDIPYILNRMKALGLDPKEIICDAEFDNRVCYFKKDHKNFDIKNKADHFEVSSKTVYICQMENYAAIRKGREELRSFSLNYIGRKELEDEKLDYSETSSIKTLAYTNYKLYILYNIKDVLLQYGIEECVEDVDALYNKSYANLTAYENCYKQTVVLRNVQYEVYDEMGLIPGANINAILLQKDMDEHPEKYTKKKKKPEYEGALVGNTALINKFGKRMFGKRTNYMFRFSIDMDMTAFYPSTIMVLNIAPSTLIFKATILADNYDVRGGDIPFHGFTDVQLVEDNMDSFSGDISAEIFDNFQTGNILSTGHKFMNLPTVTEIEREIMEKVA